MELPDALVRAAQDGDLDALHDLDDLVAEHGLLDDALAGAAARRDQGDVGATFLWAWLALDAGEPEAEVVDALGPAVAAGHPMATALHGFLVCRCLVVPGLADHGPPEDADARASFDLDRDALEQGREELRRAAGLGASVAVAYEAITHSTEHELTGDPDALTAARDLLLTSDLPQEEPSGGSALAGVTGYAWMGVGHGHQERGEREAARDCYERAVGLGRPDAVNDVGTTYDNLPDEESQRSAREWYRRAVEAGDPMGHFNLGTLLWDDGTRRRDPALVEEAEQLLRVAVEAGHLGATHNLGRLLTTGDDPAGQAEGERLLREAAGRGHGGSAVALAGWLKQDASRVDEAEVVLRRLVEAEDDHDARADLGLLLWERGTVESVAEAETLYRRALEDDPDDADVLLNLGVLLARRGEDDEDACREGREVTERAADLGQLSARYNLGNWYRDHDRPQEAAEHYRDAVARGHVASLCDLANVLQELDPPEVDEAERLLRLAASEHGHALSMNALGVLLLRHRREDAREEAHTWIERSADAGDPFGTAAWGKVLYQRGDHGAAREWLTRAAAEGSERSRTLLDAWDAGETGPLEGWR